jgi:hypothetical protein
MTAPCQHARYVPERRRILALRLPGQLTGKLYSLWPSLREGLSVGARGLQDQIPSDPDDDHVRDARRRSADGPDCVKT